MSRCYFCINFDDLTKSLDENKDINAILKALLSCNEYADYRRCFNKYSCINLRIKIRDFVAEELPNIDLFLKSIDDKLLRKSHIHDYLNSEFIMRSLKRYKKYFQKKPTNLDVFGEVSLNELLDNYVDDVTYGYINFIVFVSIILGVKDCRCAKVKGMIQSNNIDAISEALVRICFHTTDDRPYYYCSKCIKRLCDFIAGIENIHFLDSMPIDRGYDYERLNRLIKQRLDIPAIVIPNSLRPFSRLVKLFTEEKERQSTFLQCIYKNAGFRHYDIFNKDDEVKFIMKIENALKQNNCNESLKILETTLYFNVELYYPGSKDARKKLWDFIMFIPEIYKIDSLKPDDFFKGKEDALYDLLESSFDNNVPKLYDSKNLVKIVEGYFDGKDTNLLFGDFVSSILMIDYYDGDSLDYIKNRFDSLMSSFLKRPLDNNPLDIERKKFVPLENNPRDDLESKKFC